MNLASVSRICSKIVKLESKQTIKEMVLAIQNTKRYQSSNLCNQTSEIEHNIYMVCPKNADEFIKRLVTPKNSAPDEVKLEYQSILMSLLAKKYPLSVMRISPSKTLPRIENRPPEEVFKNGSSFNSKGTIDVIEHIRGVKASKLMGTSLVPQSSSIEGDYLYQVTPCEGVGLDISSILEYHNLRSPKWQKIPFVEYEIAIGRFQPPQQYKSCQKILEKYENNRIKKLGPIIENKMWYDKTITSTEFDINKLWKRALQSNLVENI